jgi:hypothetical protein
MLWFVKGNCKGHAILNVIRSAGSESEFAGGDSRSEEDSTGCRATEELGGF